MSANRIRCWSSVVAIRLVTSPNLVIASDDGPVRVLTLNRDSARNALSVELCTDLIDALITAERDRVRALVLTGAGSVFSAGADLKAKDFAGELYPLLEELMTAVRTAPMPVIAALNGPAIGAGMMLAMACDVRVSVAEAYFAIPVTDMAIGVDEATTRQLELLVGGSVARAMLLLGQRVSAQRAQELGFVLRLGGLDAALEVAQAAAAKAPLTVRQLKMDFAPDLFSPEESATARRMAWESDDNAEVRRARAEKRPTHFRGR